MLLFIAILGLTDPISPSINPFSGVSILGTNIPGVSIRYTKGSFETTKLETAVVRHYLELDL